MVEIPLIDAELKGLTNDECQLYRLGKNSVHIVWVAIMLLSNGCGESEYSPPLPDKVDFNFDIKPILVQNCYSCHGPDADGRKAGLRLDTYEGATAKLEDGRQAITPHKPGRSVLIDRITSDRQDMVMPPPESNLDLTGREIALLIKWIDQGAGWKPHWSLIKPEYEAIDEGTGHPVDHFIEKEVREKGMTLSDEASRSSLIRRLSYTLTGLPPKPEDVQSFIASNDEKAYEDMVDQYLASPAFGEKWARHWMDLVRYAETKGHEFDYGINGAWRYRDYLIRAFNEDVPYDQLVREHLAGDLLPQPRRNRVTGTNESHIATSFYAFGEGTHSPVDVRQDEADRIDNMIDVTSKTFQGLTVSCARCHDHKFDPISAADYYKLFGIMESTRFSPVPADLTLKEELDAKTIEKKKNAIRKWIADKWKPEEVELADSSYEHKNTGSKKESYRVIGDFRGSDLGNWKTDGLAFGDRTTLGDPIIDPKTGYIAKLDDGRATSRRYASGVFGVFRSPNFTIDTDHVSVRARGDSSTIRIIVDNFQLISYPIYGGIDQKVNTQDWADFVFDLSLWKGHKAYIEIMPGYFDEHIYRLPPGSYVEVLYALGHDDRKPEWSVYTDPDPVGVSTLSGLIVKWLDHKINSREKQVLERLFKQGVLEMEFPDVRPMMDEIKILADGLRDSTFYNGVYDGFGLDSHIFQRGSYKSLSGKPVPRGFLEILVPGYSKFTSPGSGRLELAEAILHEDNPLTSRVMVNRIWHHIFGKGIVETLDNFGLQGKLPSHPELLDYLAIKFRDEGWSVKKLIRHIVTSATFRRSVGNLNKDTDPSNVWLASFPLKRLEAEAIRDGILAVSGRLNREMYGPPVPLHLTDFMQGRGRPDTSGPLDGEGRRSIYQEVRRNFLEPMMLTFDRPIPFSTFGKRNVTNVPSQSLILMNSPFVVEQARVMAQNLLNHRDLTFEDKIAWIFMRSLSRKPSENEVETARRFIAEIKRTTSDDRDSNSNNLEIWQAYCHSVFNMKEFIYPV